LFARDLFGKSCAGGWQKAGPAFLVCLSIIKGYALTACGKRYLFSKGAGGLADPVPVKGHLRCPNSDIEILESSHGCVSLSHRMLTKK
jgi:hypothetical protein